MRRRQKSINNFHFIVAPKLIKNFFILVLFLACFSYLGIFVSNASSPPEIILQEPMENIIISENSVIIKGVIKNGVGISINGKQTPIDENSYFEELINLKKGVNIIKIKAHKKYGGENAVYRKILVE